MGVAPPASLLVAVVLDALSSATGSVSGGDVNSYGRPESRTTMHPWLQETTSVSTRPA